MCLISQLLKEVENAKDFKFNWTHSSIPSEVASTTFKLTSKLATLTMDEDDTRAILGVYCNEIWLGENSIGSSDATVDTIGLLEHVMANNRLLFYAALSQFPEKAQRRIWMKMHNLWGVVWSSFGPASSCEFPVYNTETRTCQMSLEHVQNLHKRLMVGLLSKSDLGQWRSVYVQPYKSSVNYARPESIASKLTALLAFINKTMSQLYQMDKTVGQLEAVLRIAAVFFRLFLLIHPFLNGNGRTARILVSELLLPFTKGPVSLYLQNPKLYLDILERTPVGVAPIELTMYVNECALRHASNVHYLLSTHLEAGR
eukprot:m.25800 g.25800  ORF g.25800 m.25800 type:complete len:314 (+) comp11628_c0_seq1:298-1239(+)